MRPAFTHVAASTMMMRPAFTRVTASKGKGLVSGACTQVPPMADGVLRWLGTTPATSCRLRGVRGVGATSGPTPSSSASAVAHKQQWQMQVVQVRFLSTMPEDELKRRMGTLMSDRTAVSPPCGSAPKVIIIVSFPSSPNDVILSFSTLFSLLCLQMISRTYSLRLDYA